MKELEGCDCMGCDKHGLGRRCGVTPAYPIISASQVRLFCEACGIHLLTGWPHLYFAEGLGENEG